MEREAKRIVQEGDNKCLEKMHGFWYGSGDNFKCEVHSIDWLPRPSRVVRAFVSATRRTDLQDLLQVRTTIDSIYLALKDILNDRGLLAFFEGNEINFDEVTPDSAII